VKEVDWGALGTLVIGLLGLVIAGLQYVGSIFWLRAEARIGPDGRGGPPTRIVVSLRNRGGAAGMIEHVVVVIAQDHKDRARVLYPGWPDRHPFPFMLPGRSSALLVIDLEEQYGESFRVLIRGNGADTCVRMSPTHYSLSPNVTALPPDSLAIVRQPYAAQDGSDAPKAGTTRQADSAARMTRMPRPIRSKARAVRMPRLLRPGGR
jgi:hypothetical protein